MNQRGFSLMQVLVAIPVVVMLAMTVATLMTNVSQQNRALSQKLEVIDLRNVMLTLFADDQRCTDILSSLATPFNPAPNSVTPLPDLRSNRYDVATTAAQIVAVTNGPLPGGRSTLFVDTVGIRNIQLISSNPTSTPPTDTYEASIEVQLRLDELKMGLRPPSVTKYLTVNRTTGRIIACTAPNGGGTAPFSCTSVTRLVPRTGAVPANCTRQTGPFRATCSPCLAGQAVSSCMATGRVTTGSKSSTSTDEVDLDTTVTQTSCQAQSPTASRITIRMTCCQ